MNTTDGMKAMRKVTINTRPVADHYSGPGEKIIEYSSRSGGGLISFTERDGQLYVDLYGHDTAVTVRVGRAS